MKKQFAQQLRQWRGKKPQSKAAAQLDVHIATYQNWEQGRNEPSKYALPAIFSMMRRIDELEENKC